MLRTLLLWFRRLGKPADQVQIFGRWLDGRPSEYVLSGPDTPLQLEAIGVAPTITEWET